MQRNYFCAVALAIGVLGNASGQAPSATESAWTGETDPAEVIEARRVVMLDIERLMIPIDEFAAGEEGDLAALKSNAETIEAMLLAFPHLFPLSTDLHEPEVREPVTRSLSAIWQDPDAFLSLSAAAESAAGAAADAEDAEALRAAGRTLRATCDGCHGQFARPYVPPEPSDEDFEFDFESVLSPDEQ